MFKPEMKEGRHLVHTKQARLIVDTEEHKGRFFAILRTLSGETIKSVEFGLKTKREMEGMAPQWREGVLWALLGGNANRRLDAKPMASTYAHPGALRV